MENKTKYLLIGGAVIAVTGGYFLYKYLTQKGSENATEDFTEAIESNKLPAPSSSSSAPRSTPTYHPKPASSGFPLKMKSKGPKVKAVQAALIKKYPSALPKYKDDGYYGNELRDTLIAKGLPTEIDSDLYDKIVSGKAWKDSKENTKKPTKEQASLGHESIADLMYSGVMQKSMDTCLRALFKIKDVQGYIKANEVFKTKRIDGVRKTIATALSHAFPYDPNRKKYRSQLYRIGLKWRNEQWALAGFLGDIPNRLMAVKRAKIWDSKGNNMLVPAGTIIGSFLSAKNGLTEFLTLDGRRLYIETISIKYHHD